MTLLTTIINLMFHTVFICSLPFVYIIYYLFYPITTVQRPVRSVPVGNKGNNCTPVYRRVGFESQLKSIADDNCLTLCDLLQRSAELYMNEKSLGQRTTVNTNEKIQYYTDSNGNKKQRKLTIQWQTDYKWITYHEMYELVKSLNRSYIELCNQVKQPLEQSDKIAIYCSTRSEWQIASHAAWQSGLVAVTCYPSLGSDALLYSLEQCKIKLIVTEIKLLSQQLHKIINKLTSLHTIIYVDNYDERSMYATHLDEITQQYPTVHFVSYNDAIKLGETIKNKKLITNTTRPKPTDLAVIMYTSGSTGNPKGVQITHENIITQVSSIFLVLPNVIDHTDIYIAFLPLAHILELAAENTILFIGGKLGYSSAQTLRDEQVNNAEGKPAGDLTLLKPTLMAMVPAIADKLKSAIEDTLKKQGTIAQYIFNICYYLKKRNFLSGQSSPVLDKIIFNKIAGKFGGQLRIILSGGAPLSPSSQMFITLCFKAPVLQGYGLTETTGGCSVCLPDDVEFGHVGGVLPGCEVKLVDCPEMGYMSTDKNPSTGALEPRGEIAIRGSNVSNGYYQMDDKTKADFRYELDNKSYPYFYSGDIGKFDSSGNLWIIDRKKDLVKLRNGEYIALGKLESIYQESTYIDNICIHGNATIDAPVAVVTLNHDTYKSIKNCDIDTAVDDPDIINGVLKSIRELGNKHNINKAEIPNKIGLIKDQWTPDSGMVTEAMKLKRQAVEKQYHTKFTELYKQAGGTFKQ